MRSFFVILILLPKFLLLRPASFKTSYKMKILIPVDPAKRKPAMYKPDGIIYNAVPVRVSLKSHNDHNWMSIAYWDDQEAEWHDSQIIKMLFSVKLKNYEVIEWYEEIEFEALCPHEDIASGAALSAFGRSFDRQVAHIEGQSYIKNHIIKSLKK